MTVPSRQIRFAALSICLVIGLTAIAAAAQTAPPELSWADHLARIKEHAATVGIQVNALPSGRLVYENHAKTPLIAASLAKILTSYAALRKLGPGYRFQTAFYAHGRVRGRTLEGKLVVKGGGDPYLFAKDLWQIAAHLKASGIERITRGVFIDPSLFQPATEPLCLDGRCERSYNPMISALALEYNTIAFHLSPGEAIGRPARVSWFPPGDYAVVINHTTTTAAGHTEPALIRSRGPGENGREVFEVSGPVRAASTEGLEFRLNVWDPIAFAARTLADILRRVGIETGPETGVERVDPQALRLYAHSSPPLGDLLFGLNRYSNNFMAETLLRVLGAEQAGAGAGAAAGLQVVVGELGGLGIAASELQLDSGSGLSRDTRASARTFNRVLLDLFDDFNAGPEFLSSLAREGQAGTLSKRLRGGGAAEGIMVRGKTGTLDQVVGFSGYLAASRTAVAAGAPGGDRRFAVTVILNDVARLREARQVLDELLAAIPRLAAAEK